MKQVQGRPTGVCGEVDAAVFSSRVACPSYFLKSSRRQVLRLISAGDRPADSSQATILHPYPMLDYRLLHRNRDCRQASSDVTGSFRIAESPQSLSNRLVQRLRRDLHAVLDAIQIAAGDLGSPAIRARAASFLIKK